MRFLTKSEKRATKSCLIIKTDHKKEVKHAGIEEWPHQAAASYEKQDFFYTTLFNYLSGIRTTPSFFLPSIFTTIGLSKRT